MYCRLRCSLFREEDACTYLSGASLKVVVKINLIFPEIEPQPFTRLLFRSWISLFLKRGMDGIA